MEFTNTEAKTKVNTDKNGPLTGQSIDKGTAISAGFHRSCDVHKTVQR